MVTEGGARTLMQIAWWGDRVKRRRLDSHGRHPLYCAALAIKTGTTTMASDTPPLPLLPLSPSQLIPPAISVRVPPSVTTVVIPVSIAIAAAVAMEMGMECDDGQLRWRRAKSWFALSTSGGFKPASASYWPSPSSPSPWGRRRWPIP